MTPTSKPELLIANEPTMQNSRMIGISTLRGTRSRFFAALMHIHPSGIMIRFARMNSR